MYQRSFFRISRTKCDRAKWHCERRCTSVRCFPTSKECTEAKTEDNNKEDSIKDEFKIEKETFHVDMNKQGSLDNSNLFALFKCNFRDS